MKNVKYILLILLGVFTLILITIIFLHFITLDLRELHRQMELDDKDQYIEETKERIISARNTLVRYRDQSLITIVNIEELDDNIERSRVPWYIIPAYCGCRIQFNKLEQSYDTLKISLDKSNLDNFIPQLDEILVNLDLLDSCIDKCGKQVIRSEAFEYL